MVDLPRELRRGIDANLAVGIREAEDLMDMAADEIDRLSRQLAGAQGEVERMREALKPFADFHIYIKELSSWDSTKGGTPPEYSIGKFGFGRKELEAAWRAISREKPAPAAAMGTTDE